MIEWIKKTLSHDPLASYSRQASALSALVFLALNVYSVFKARGVVAGLSRDALIGQAVFISSIYGCGKLGETAQKFADKGGDH